MKIAKDRNVSICKCLPLIKTLLLTIIPITKDISRRKTPITFKNFLIGTFLI